MWSAKNKKLKKPLKAVLAAVAYVFVGAFALYMIAGFLTLLVVSSTINLQKPSESLSHPLVAREAPALKKNEILLLTLDRKDDLLEYYQMVVRSAAIVETDPGFDPCQAVCSSPSKGDVMAEGEDHRKNLEELYERYEKNPRAALKDPRFNRVVLFTASLKSAIPPSLVEMFRRWDVSKKNVVLENPGLTARLLLELPPWLYTLKTRMRRMKRDGRTIENFTKLAEQCTRGRVSRKNAVAQCQPLFKDYSFAKKYDTSLPEKKEKR